MSALFDASIRIRDFMELGGPVLNIIAGAVFVMWTLIVERIVYFRTTHRQWLGDTLQSWKDRRDRGSWNSQRVREALISRCRVAANGPIPLIKTLVAVCPLLGLLGTAGGMIEVFDVLAISGTGNVRSVASGVSQATITTMAGMVAALSGVFAGSVLSRRARREVEQLTEALTLDH